MKRMISPIAAFLLFGGLIGLLGCSSNNAPKPAAEVAAQKSGKAGSADIQNDEEHGHKPSAHGGILVPIGRDNYHAEAVFEKGGLLRLYMLGQDETKVQEVEAQPLNAYVKAEGDPEAVSLVLRSEPQPGDKTGMTSMFLGNLPKDLVGKRLEVTIPSVSIKGERFRIAFRSVPAEATDHGMPTKVADESEQKLYLTAAGAYTEADIKANGGVTASQKFKGFKAQHDLKPKSGDKICPVTMTKANPKCAWIIGGKTYEFCCPPCVDEFVALAKENPSEIKEPDAYRKK
jgi:YHS domain-containing protein